MHSNMTHFSCPSRRRCQQYSLLGSLGSLMYQGEEEGMAKDLAAQRSEKIAKFQRQKTINAELQRLQELRKRRTALEQAST